MSEDLQLIVQRVRQQRRVHAIAGLVLMAFAFGLWCIPHGDSATWALIAGWSTIVFCSWYGAMCVVILFRPILDDPILVLLAHAPQCIVQAHLECRQSHSGSGIFELKIHTNRGKKLSVSFENESQARRGLALIRKIAPHANLGCPLPTLGSLVATDCHTINDDGVGTGIDPRLLPVIADVRATMRFAAVLGAMSLSLAVGITLLVLSDWWYMKRAIGEVIACSLIFAVFFGLPGWLGLRTWWRGPTADRKIRALTDKHSIQTWELLNVNGRTRLLLHLSGGHSEHLDLCRGTEAPVLAYVAELAPCQNATDDIMYLK